MEIFPTGIGERQAGKPESQTRYGNGAEKIRTPVMFFVVDKGEGWAI